MIWNLRVNSLFTVRDLVLSHNKKPVLALKEFTVADNEVVAIVGSNGSGKTTLLNFIVGVRTTVNVRYAFCERNYNDVAFVPDNTVNYFSSLAPAQAFTYLRNKVPCHHDVIAGLRKGFGFNRELLRSRISDLSYGEHKKVYLMLALTKIADLYVMDEPFAGLDGSSRSFLQQQIAELRAQGKSAILVDHNRGLLSRISDKTIELA